MGSKLFAKINSTGCVKSSDIMTDNADPDQTAPFGAVIWVQTVQLQK